jgi:hypothetical protein
MWRIFATGELVPKFRENPAQNAVSWHLLVFERNLQAEVVFPVCGAILKKVHWSAFLRERNFCTLLYDKNSDTVLFCMI